MPGISLRVFIVFASLIGLSACVTAPVSLMQAPSESPAIAAVQSSPAAHIGESVMWGGSILKVENSDEKTHIWVVAKPLYRNGAPARGDNTQGRFIVEFDGFFDPALYASGRSITVVGEIAETRSELIDVHNYLYPVVKSSSHQLWPKQVYAAARPHHYWLDECRRAYRRGYYDPLHPRNLRLRHRCHGVRLGVFLHN